MYYDPVMALITLRARPGLLFSSRPLMRRMRGYRARDYE